MLTNIVFFGTSRFAVFVLEELENINVIPRLIITAKDKPSGRGLSITPPPVKVWANERKIKILQPDRLDEETRSAVAAEDSHLYLVAAYGKIIPAAFLSIPRFGSLNVHPSLLPRYRGPTPIQSQILVGEKEIGVTVILMDEKVDHGPTLTSWQLRPDDWKGVWPPRADDLEEKLGREGGKLLGKVIPQWLSGAISPQPQDDSRATYTRKFTRNDGHLDLSADPAENLRKIRAFCGWPGTYFFAEMLNGKKLRVVVKDAELKEGKLTLRKVIPEGKKEIDYESFLRTSHPTSFDGS